MKMRVVVTIENAGPIAWNKLVLAFRRLAPNGSVELKEISVLDADARGPLIIDKRESKP